MMQSADKETVNQVTYMMDQLMSDATELCASEGEAPEAGDEDEDISYYAEATDEARDGDAPKGEELLLGEFLATTEEALQQSKTISQHFADPEAEEEHVTKEEKGSKADRPVTPIMTGGGQENAPLIDSRVPSAMRARPKIPRTPIPVDKLQKANEELLKVAYYVQKNEGSNKKKPQPQKSGRVESDEELKQEPRPKPVRSEAKTRGEERKKEHHYAPGQKKKEAAPAAEPVTCALNM